MPRSYAVLEIPSRRIEDVGFMTEETPRKGSLLKKILIVLGLVIVAFVVVVALQPSEYRVVRAKTMSAPAAAVFTKVNDFHNWDAWSPWAKLDPNVEYTYEGPPAGDGAILRWKGNSDVGAGSMTILESRPSELIRIKLEFTEPFASVATNEFRLQAEGERTAVTWDMSGENNFVGKAFCLFMDMDKMIGGDFERGLKNPCPAT
jgi:hypothetical protein